MKKFQNWLELKEFNAGQMGNNIPLGQNQPQNQAPVGNNMPQQASPINEEPIKAMLRKRLEQVFQELDGYRIPKSRQIHLLTSILMNFKQQYGLNRSQMGTAVRNAYQPPVDAN